ncbi:MAG: hypothetical protein EOR03_00340 [Mesorhizobium sp.]|nr:MAG: hypothetical protein EOR03_00340 [Mesorhizobium sp.]
MCRTDPHESRRIGSFASAAVWGSQLQLIHIGSARHLVPVMIAVKVLGAAAILSRFSVHLSDLAYAGMFYHLLLSCLAHVGVRKPGGALPAAVGLTLLAASFLTQNAVREVPSPYVLTALL